MNNLISFTVVLPGGTFKEYKSGEDIRAYYTKDEVYKVFLHAPGISWKEVDLNTIFNSLKNHGHLVHGGITPAKGKVCGFQGDTENKEPDFEY